MQDPKRNDVWELKSGDTQHLWLCTDPPFDGKNLNTQTGWMSSPSHLASGKRVGRLLREGTRIVSGMRVRCLDPDSERKQGDYVLTGRTTELGNWETEQGSWVVTKKEIAAGRVVLLEDEWQVGATVECTKIAKDTSWMLGKQYILKGKFSHSDATGWHFTDNVGRGVRSDLQDEHFRVVKPPLPDLVKKVRTHWTEAVKKSALGPGEPKSELRSTEQFKTFEQREREQIDKIKQAWQSR